ncbi:hypothetical protein Tco_1165259 [Tanacetum coccineum]
MDPWFLWSLCSLVVEVPRVFDHSSANHSLADHTSGHSTSDQSLSRHSSPSLPLGMRPRSPATTVPSSIPALGALVPTRADLLPPRKRFRDSISPEDSVEEDIDADVLTDIKVDAMVVEVAAKMDVEAGVDTGIGMKVDVGVDIEDEDEGEAKSSDRGTMEVEEVVYDIYGHVMEIPLQRVEDIKMGQRELKARSLIAGGERASLLDRVVAFERSNARLRGPLRMASTRVNRLRFRRLEAFTIMTITRSGMTPEAIEELINQRVAEALATYEANHAAELVVESQSQNEDDGGNENGGGNGNGNGEGNGDQNGKGNRNRNGGGNRNGNPNRNDRVAMPIARECTYHDFVKCQTLNFKGTEGVVGLSDPGWIKYFELCDSCIIKALKSPKHGIQLLFLKHNVLSARGSSFLITPHKFSVT